MYIQLWYVAELRFSFSSLLDVLEKLVPEDRISRSDLADLVGNNDVEYLIGFLKFHGYVRDYGDEVEATNKMSSEISVR